MPPCGGGSVGTPGQHVGETAFRRCTEHPLARELRAGRSGTGDAAEESCTLPGRSERIWMQRRTFGERVAVDELIELRLRFAVGQLLCESLETEAAVPARLSPWLAEVADELVHLAAVVHDERDDPGDPLGLGLLATREAPAEPVDEGVDGIRVTQQRVALARVGRPELDDSL